MKECNMMKTLWAVQVEQGSGRTWTSEPCYTRRYAETVLMSRLSLGDRRKAVLVWTDVDIEWHPVSGTTG